MTLHFLYYLSSKCATTVPHPPLPACRFRLSSPNNAGDVLPSCPTHPATRPIMWSPHQNQPAVANFTNCQLPATPNQLTKRSVTETYHARFITLAVDVRWCICTSSQQCSLLVCLALCLPARSRHLRLEWLSCIFNQRLLARLISYPLYIFTSIYFSLSSFNFGNSFETLHFYSLWRTLIPMPPAGLSSPTRSQLPSSHPIRLARRAMERACRSSELSLFPFTS